MIKLIKKLIKPKKKHDYITKIEVTPYWADVSKIKSENTKKEIKNVK